ncbi:MAG: aminotransferase class V-fold PLP-dependent enzyme [Taibaiella sp.]|jgi:selenocysteine lyase/cysteine desulfurase
MSLRNIFPVLTNTTYLNTASSGILYDSLYQWRKEHDLAYLQAGSGFRVQQASFLEGVKDSLAHFFKSDRTFTFLVANFSSGYNAFLDGLSGDHRFLLPSNEYPSVYYQVQSRGFAYDMVSLGDHLEERIVEHIRQFKPTIFAFSLVQYSNGVKLDHAFIGELKNLFPELILVADGTQYCGSESFDFGSSAIDVLIASGYKWMLGSYGNGFVLIKETIASRLYVEAQNRPLPEEAFLKHKSRLALRFEPGHQDTLSFGSLQHSLSFLTQTGYSFIEKQIATLAKQAKAAFTERGLLDDYIMKRPTHSSILKLNIDDALVRKIADENITGTSRGSGLRVSFHFYNETEDLNKLLDVIDKNR